MKTIIRNYDIILACAFCLAGWMLLLMLIKLENKDQPAFPDPMRGAPSTYDNQVPDKNPAGLSKREYIAAKVLPECIGLFTPESPKEAAALAVEYADALLSELEK